MAIGCGARARATHAGCALTSAQLIAGTTAGTGIITAGATAAGATSAWHKSCGRNDGWRNGASLGSAGAWSVDVTTLPPSPGAK